MAQSKGTMREAGRAMHLRKKREKQKEQMAVLKRRIAEETLTKSTVGKKFSAHCDALEAELQSSTVGLVTLNDMKAKQEALVRERERQLARREQLEARRGRERRRQRQRQRQTCSWSFALDERDEAPEGAAAAEEQSRPSQAASKRRRPLGKNPDVGATARRRTTGCGRSCGGNGRRSARRWRARSAAGTAPREVTVQPFLRKALQGLRGDLRELRAASVQQLVFIKEDLLLPHYHAFHDLIVTKARGKSRPLFSFHVHDDVRLPSDATTQKDESHAGS